MVESQATGADERRLFGTAAPAVAPSPGMRPTWRAPAGFCRAAGFRRLRALLADLTAAAGRAIATDADRGAGFLLLPVFMACGAVAWFAAAREPPVLTVAAGLVLCGALALFTAARPLLRYAMLAAAMTFAGMGAAHLEMARQQTQMSGSPVTTRLTGRIMRMEHRPDGRIRLTLDVLATERPHLRFAPSRIRATAAHAPPGSAPGAVVTGVVRLIPPSGPVRPGGYDFAFEAYFDGVGAIGFFLGAPEAGPPALMTAGERLSAWIENARDALAARVRARIGGPEGEIAAALIAGVRAGIPEDVNEALRRTGLAHVLSISGLHMALVAATFMVSMRAAFALFPGFASRRPVKKYAAAVALAACAVYLAVSGAAVAAQRSFIMLAVMLLALLFDRAALTMRNLAISALIVLAISPHEAIGPSFQMSFAATAALIGGYAAWSDWRARRHAPAPQDRGLMRRVASNAARFAFGLAMTSVIAGLATTIYGVYHFHRVSAYALGANMLAMPVVSAIVMPSAVGAVLLIPLGLDGPALDLMGWGIGVMNAIAFWFSDRTPIDVVGMLPLGALAAFTAALVVATVSTTWLRIAALPFAVAGFCLIFGRQLPDVLVSEDARLVAVRLEDGSLAVNRARPNAFTFDNWKAALGTGTWHRPQKGDPAAPRAAPGDPLAPAAKPPAPAGFVCDETACAMTATGGRVVVHAADAGAAKRFCAGASLIVIDDATQPSPCPPRTSLAVVTKRDLARHGSLAATLPGPAGQKPVDLTFAIREPYRPWHEHRQFSREARGLPPRARPPAVAGSGPQAPDQ